MTPMQRSAWLIALLVGCAAALAWDRLHAPAVVLSKAVPRPAGQRTGVPTTANEAPAEAITRLRPRADYLAGGSDAFAVPRPPARPAPRASAVVVAEPVAASVPARPVAPALPFTVVGKKVERGVLEIYLAKGEQIYIATPGAALGDDYRVESIGPTQMTLTYLPLNEKQTLLTGATLND